MKSILVLVMVSFMVGCAALGPQSNQGSAGITAFNIEKCELAGEATACEISFTDGKDKAYVEIKIETPQGYKAHYVAKDVTGLSAIEARASVEKAFAEAGVDIVPSVVEKLVKAITTL